MPVVCSKRLKSSIASTNCKQRPQNAPKKPRKNASKNSTNSDATHTQIKPTPQQFPPSWVKPKSSISPSSNTTSAAKSTSAKPAALKTLGVSCFNPSASKSLT